MPAFYRSPLQSFLAQPIDAILNTLTSAYAHSGYTDLKTKQTLTWEHDLPLLQEQCAKLVCARPDAALWSLLLEFSIPRKEQRIDALLLTPEAIILLECKRSSVSLEAVRQLESYALLLHYFHQPSARRRLVPLVLSEGFDAPHLSLRDLSQPSMSLEALPSFWIAPIQVISWTKLSATLSETCPPGQASVIDAAHWEAGAYRPTPTILEAARALRSGLHIREIAQSEAAEHDIASVTETISALVASARASNDLAICFLTGVPGSGKTLVGLSLAHLAPQAQENSSEAIHFMSGNGPLVRVLQELFRRQAMRDGISAIEAKIQARTLIENVHVFARTYAEFDLDRPPSNHVIVFDEAQRAWNRQHNSRKFKRNYSEPEMLLRIMERHKDWAVVIALVGGGQEINTGEAGLEEWGHALAVSSRPWKIFASPEVLQGGPSTANHRLFVDDSTPRTITKEVHLHLRTSNRSLRAERLAEWVNLVLEGDAGSARTLRVADRFPLLLTRSLLHLRARLRAEAIADSRFGLVASSNAARLRAEGLEPNADFHAAYPWHHWYLAPREDVRSSYACEVFATEFEVQGLELDWIGLCWGGDMIWTGDRWLARNLRFTTSTRWSPLKQAEQVVFRRNAYRVLLTRARQGLVLFVPQGDPDDPTRNPTEFNRTAEYLIDCGVLPIDFPSPGR